MINHRTAMAEPRGVERLAAQWDAFCDGLRAAGHDTLATAANSPDAADGLAQFGMLLEASLRWNLRGGDPDNPRFIEINDTPEVADNLFAAVKGGAAYRVSGDVSSLFDINLSVHSSWAWLKPSKPTGDLGLAELEVADDGRVDIFLGGEPRSRNWLALPDDAQFIQIREYHADYSSHRPGQWDIERIDGKPPAPDRLSAEAASQKLLAALEWARRYASFHQAALSFTFPDAPNALRPPAPHAGTSPPTCWRA